MRTWSDRYGVGPWATYTKDPSNMIVVVDGRPAEYAFRVALARMGLASRIELIQPLDDAGPYARSLAEHEERDHVHHVRLDVADHDAVREHLRALDVPETMTATFNGADPAGARSSARTSTRRRNLGWTLEIGQAPPGFAMPEPELVYPPADAT